MVKSKLHSMLKYPNTINFKDLQTKYYGNKTLYFIVPENAWTFKDISDAIEVKKDMKSVERKNVILG